MASLTSCSSQPVLSASNIGRGFSVFRPVACQSKPWQQFSGASKYKRTPPAAAAHMAEASDLVNSRRPSVDLSTSLSLDNIRQALIRQEDTIIFSLIERAQFARNDAVYEPDAIPVPGFQPDGRRYSLLEYLLRETEQMHGKIRRYTSPDEHAFYPDDLPPLAIPPISYEKVLSANARAVNLNDKVMELYLQHIVPGITQPGDDNNYGSTAMYDVLALQALSKRIHYGKFVAEAKFRAQPDVYHDLIQRQDANAIMQRLTDRGVELKVVERVRRKAAMFGQDISADAGTNGNGAMEGDHFKVSPAAVAELYDQWVMPMTKQVQVAYLLRRLDNDA